MLIVAHGVCLPLFVFCILQKMFVDRRRCEYIWQGCVSYFFHGQESIKVFFHSDQYSWRGDVFVRCFNQHSTMLFLPNSKGIFDSYVGKKFCSAEGAVISKLTTLAYTRRAVRKTKSQQQIKTKTF